MRTLILKEPLTLGARGRNGWITPTSIDVLGRDGDPEPTLRLAVNSRRPGGLEPIVLLLSTDDALELANTITRTVQDLEQHQAVPVVIPIR